MHPGPNKLAQALTRDERPASWLARKLSVAPSSVTRWLSGQTAPRERQRIAIERMFDIKADEWGRE